MTKKHFSKLLIIIFLISCSNEVTTQLKFSENKTPYRSVSLLLSSWSALSDSDLEVRIQDFWKKQKNFPLVEKDSLDNENIYITFIYRDSSKNIEVEFDIFGNYEDTNLGDRKLYRLRNSDLYYRTYGMPSDICFSYRFNIKDTLTGKEYKVTDKYNTDRIPMGEVRSLSYSVLDLRKNEIDWNAKRYNNINSRLDTIKYKDKIVNKERNIYIYLPPDYDKNRKDAYPVIYLFDAYIYLNRVEVPNILDNLITEGKIEPMIAVLFGTYRSTRDIILPLNFVFKDEFVSEFLPIIRKNYNISLNPENNIIGGMSYGGLAATFIGFYHPEIFGKILSQSGSFWRDTTITEPFMNWHRSDWLINKFKKTEKKDIRIYLDWGQQESHVMVQGANRKFVRTLDKLGYDYKYIEFSGWHDWSNSRKTFPQGLIYLLND